MPKQRDEADVELECDLINETASAILVKSEFGKDVWLPKSMIRDFKDRKDGTCSFTLTESAATQKGLV